MSAYTVSDTPSGHKTLVRNHPRESRIHSGHDPLKEAERAALQFNPGRATIIIVCGTGLGYQAAQLKVRFPDATILALEKDPEVLALADRHALGNLDGVHRVCAQTDLPAIFESMDLTRFRGCARFIHRPSYQLDPVFYDAMVRDINQYISSKLSDLLTRIAFEERWIANVLENAPALFSDYTVQSLFGKFRGIPAIIVSAGPSLRANVRDLARFRDRALIVAVDTALKILQTYGIDPHLVMTLDAQKYSVRHFLGLKNHAPALLADIVSQPRVLRLYRGIRIISTTAKYYTDTAGSLQREATPVMDWLERHVAPIMVGDIQSGGSVATSVFDLLLNLGCDPIILMGQDLAYTGREIHCTGTYHTAEWLAMSNRLLNVDTINQNVIRRRRIKYVERYGGAGTVISDFVFDLYKGWFEDSAGKVDRTVYNATGGGARIKNTVERSLAELSELLPRPDSNPQTILDRSLAAPATKDPGQLLVAVRQAIDDISRIEDLSRKALAGNDSDREAIDRLLGSDTIQPFLNPLLKKTLIYLARHELSEERSRAIMLSDIASSASRIVKLLTKCEKKLQTIR